MKLFFITLGFPFRLTFALFYAAFMTLAFIVVGIFNPHVSGLDECLEDAWRFVIGKPFKRRPGDEYIY